MARFFVIQQRRSTLTLSATFTVVTFLSLVGLNLTVPLIVEEEEMENRRVSEGVLCRAQSDIWKITFQTKVGFSP
jgi:hypothetical protein